MKTKQAQGVAQREGDAMDGADCIGTENIDVLDSIKHAIYEQVHSRSTSSIHGISADKLCPNVTDCTLILKALEEMRAAEHVSYYNMFEDDDDELDIVNEMNLISVYPFNADIDNMAGGAQVLTQINEETSLDAIQASNKAAVESDETKGGTEP